MSDCSDSELAPAELELALGLGICGKLALLVGDVDEEACALLRAGGQLVAGVLQLFAEGVARDDGGVLFGLSGGLAVFGAGERGALGLYLLLYLL